MNVISLIPGGIWGTSGTEEAVILSGVVMKSSQKRKYLRCTLKGEQALSRERRWKHVPGRGNRCEWGQRVARGGGAVAAAVGTGGGVGHTWLR